MKTSIIITSYNYGAYIERCLRSCFNQKLVDGTNEIIVVDDCSTDNTLEVIQKFSRFPNVHIIANQKNLGVAESANIGIRAACGQYVVRVDADDFISENFVFFLRSYLEMNHDALGVACDYVLVDDHEDTMQRCDAGDKPISCAIMYRRDLLVKMGLYNPEFRHREEEELRARLGEFYTVHHLKMPLYRYRMHASNKTKMPEYEEFRHKVAALSS